VRARRGLALFAGGAFALGCGGVWDVGALEERHPPLASVRAHHLGDATPYLLPRDGGLTLFLCRWRTGRALRVALPADAALAERALLERALSAWQGALPGVAFERVAGPSEAEIEIAFGAPGAARTAETAADCAVDLDAAGEPGALSAQLVAAHVRLRRAERDWRGREVALTDEQLLGSALHELGHALGFQGHVRRGRSVMVRSVDEVKLAARRLLGGEPFRDATVAALYRVPSGVVVARHALPAGRTEQIDRLRAAARELGLAGPVVRVGDRGARISWHSAHGRDYGFFMPRVSEVLRDAGSFALEPSASTAALLESGRAP
jgi:hypothetical protein